MGKHSVIRMFMATMSKITKLKPIMQWLNKLQNAYCGIEKWHYRRIFNNLALVRKKLSFTIACDTYSLKNKSAYLSFSIYIYIRVDREINMNKKILEGFTQKRSQWSFKWSLFLLLWNHFTSSLQTMVNHFSGTHSISSSHTFWLCIIFKFNKHIPFASIQIILWKVQQDRA